jgi:triosephosphate isomerase
LNEKRQPPQPSRPACLSPPLANQLLDSTDSDNALAIVKLGDEPMNRRAVVARGIPQSVGVNPGIGHIQPGRLLIAGNWKMNGLAASLSEAQAVASALAGIADLPHVAICPPATLIAKFAHALKGTQVALGGQDCNAATHGSYTGEISAEMLVDAGASYVVLGHSERRINNCETDEQVAAKSHAAISAGLTPIICVGETLHERDEGRALAVIGQQLTGALPQSFADKEFAIAYEPVWAIGTGKTPTGSQIEEVHAFIRRRITDLLGTTEGAARILYGGSVNRSNAEEILKLREVGGALVGGASLRAVDFLPIIDGRFNQPSD